MEKQGARQKERADAKTTAQVWEDGPIYFWDTWLDDGQLHVFSVGAEGGEPVNLTVGPGGGVRGPIISESALRLASGVTVGTEATPTTVSGRTVVLASGAVVCGHVVTEEGGQTEE